MTFLRRSLRTPAGLLVVPALKEAVEGQDGQGAQDVHDPSPQVHLSGTAQTEAGSWWMFSSIVPESIQVRGVAGVSSLSLFVFLPHLFHLCPQSRPVTVDGMFPPS